MSSSLSPAAQAVKHAAVKAYWLFHSGQTAAALRAAADQVVPEQGCPIYGLTQKENERQQVRNQFLAIAAELEATND